MGLVLFAILFLFGARGMGRRRGISFGLITGSLLFLWVLPLIIDQAQANGAIFIVIDAFAALVVALLLPLLFYFSGRWTLPLVAHVGTALDRIE